YTGPGLFTIDDGDFWLDANQVMSNLQMAPNGFIDGPGDLVINGLMNLSYGTIMGGGSLSINATATLLIVNNPITLDRNVTNAGMTVLSNSTVLAAQPWTWVNLP